jgi:hypothetical protein
MRTVSKDCRTRKIFGKEDITAVGFLLLRLVLLFHNFMGGRLTGRQAHGVADSWGGRVVSGQPMRAAARLISTGLPLAANHRRINPWGTVPIFVRRKWDCPLTQCDSYLFLRRSPNTVKELTIFRNSNYRESRLVSKRIATTRQPAPFVISDEPGVW